MAPEVNGAGADARRKLACRTHIGDVVRWFDHPKVYQLLDHAGVNPWEFAWLRACALITSPSEVDFRLLAHAFLGLPADRIDALAEEVIGGPSEYSGPFVDTAWSRDLLARAQAMVLSDPPMAQKLRQHVAVGVPNEATYRTVLAEVLRWGEDAIDHAVAQVEATTTAAMKREEALPAEDPALPPGPHDRATRIVDGLAAYLPTLPGRPLPLAELRNAIKLTLKSSYDSTSYATQAIAKAVRALLAFAPEMPTVWEASLLSVQREMTRQGRAEDASRIADALRRRVVDAASFREVMKPILGHEQTDDLIASTRATLPENQPHGQHFSAEEMRAVSADRHGLLAEVTGLRSQVRKAHGDLAAQRAENTAQREQLDKTAGHLRKLRQVRDRGIYPVQVIAGALEGLGRYDTTALTGPWVAALAHLLDRDGDPTEAFQAAFRETFAAERKRIVGVAGLWLQEASKLGPNRMDMLTFIDREPLPRKASYGERILYCFGSRSAHRDMTLDQVIAEVAPEDRAAFDAAWEDLVRDERIVLYGAAYGGGRWGYAPSTEKVRTTILEALSTPGGAEPLPRTIPLRWLREGVDRRLVMKLSDKAFDLAFYPMLGTGEVSAGYVDGDSEVRVVRGPWPDAVGRATTLAAPGKRASSEPTHVIGNEPVPVAKSAPPLAPLPTPPAASPAPVAPVLARDRSPAGPSREEPVAVAVALDGEWLARIPYPDPAGVPHALSALVSADGQVVLRWGKLLIADGQWDFTRQDFAAWTIPGDSCPLLPPGETMWPAPVHAALQELRKALATVIPVGTVAALAPASPAPKGPWSAQKAKGILLQEAGCAFTEGSTAVAEAWLKASNSGAWQSEEAFTAAFQAIGPALHTLDDALTLIRS